MLMHCICYYCTDTETSLTYLTSSLHLKLTYFLFVKENTISIKDNTMYVFSTSKRFEMNSDEIFYMFAHFARNALHA